MAVSWEKCENGALCFSPVRGHTGNNAPIVAAAHHKGGFIPGMYMPESGICQIPWGCNAIYKSEFYLLSSPQSSYLWVKAFDGKVPVGALEAGVAETGEPLYIGRFKRNGKMLLGKVHPSHKVCYVPFEETEQNNRNYEVLCLKTVPMNPLSKSIEIDEVLCPVCSEQYGSGLHDPLMLPNCGHTFCRSCLLRLVDEMMLICPSCRTPHREPPIEELKVNFALLSLSEKGKNKETEVSGI